MHALWDEPVAVGCLSLIRKGLYWEPRTDTPYTAMTLILGSRVSVYDLDDKSDLTVTQVLKGEWRGLIHQSSE
jgi:hypothetical protein